MAISPQVARFTGPGQICFAASDVTPVYGGNSRVLLSNQKSVFTQLAATIFVVRQDWMLMVKRATSLFDSFWGNVVKQVTRSCCPCFWFRSILYSERCAHICLAPSQNLNVWRPNIFMFEPTLNLFSCCSRVHAPVGSKRRHHSSRVCVAVTGRDSCRFCTMFLYWCSEDLN